MSEQSETIIWHTDGTPDESAQPVLATLANGVVTECYFDPEKVDKSHSMTPMLRASGWYVRSDEGIEDDLYFEDDKVIAWAEWPKGYKPAVTSP